MGRVSKYKRVKTVDPFYRGRRRAALNRGFDLRPDNEDQPVPKSLTRLMRRAELLQEAGKKKRKPSHQEQSREERVTEHTQKKTTAQSSQSTGPELGEGPMFRRRKGESLKKYLERVDMESNARIMEAFRKGRGMRERRKRYLEERRKKLQLRKRGGNREEAMEFSNLTDEVRFGEVVMAPPQLQAQPKGALSHSKRAPTLLLHQKLSQPENSSKTKSGPKAVVGLKRKQDLEIERKRAIHLYRQGKRVKTKRMGST